MHFYFTGTFLVKIGNHTVYTMAQKVTLTERTVRCLVLLMTKNTTEIGLAFIRRHQHNKLQIQPSKIKQENVHDTQYMGQ